MDDSKLVRLRKLEKFRNNSFELLFMDEKLSDVHLFCDEEVIKAHRFVLLLGSSYFKRLFTKFSDIKTQFIIALPFGVAIEELRIIVEFLYKNEVYIKPTQLEAVLNVVKILEVKGMSYEIVNIVSDNLNKLTANQEMGFSQPVESKNGHEIGSDENLVIENPKRKNDNSKSINDYYRKVKKIKFDKLNDSEVNMKSVGQRSSPPVASEGNEQSVNNAKTSNRDRVSVVSSRPNLAIIEECEIPETPPSNHGEVNDNTDDIDCDIIPATADFYHYFTQKHKNGPKNSTPKDFIH